MTIAPGNDIQLRGLGRNGVASMAVKKMMASRREKGTMQAHMKKIPRVLKLAQFWLIILTMTALLILGELDTSIVATALLSITDDFSRLDPKISFGVEYHWSLLVIYRKVSCPAYISKRII
ncbi:unnamed protein product [Penicillium palitans]